MKCFEITPSPDPHYDSMIVQAGDSWQEALNIAEQSLDNQYIRAKDDGTSWSNFSVTIRCVEKTQEELEELPYSD